MDQLEASETGVVFDHLVRDEAVEDRLAQVVNVATPAIGAARADDDADQARNGRRPLLQE